VNVGGRKGRSGSAWTPGGSGIRDGNVGGGGGALQVITDVVGGNGEKGFSLTWAPTT